jgi:hypothetical protein
LNGKGQKAIGIIIIKLPTSNNRIQKNSYIRRCDFQNSVKNAHERDGETELDKNWDIE